LPTYTFLLLLLLLHVFLPFTFQYFDLHICSSSPKGLNPTSFSL
jgi:hypothetical protein